MALRSVLDEFCVIGVLYSVKGGWVALGILAEYHHIVQIINHQSSIDSNLILVHVLGSDKHPPRTRPVEMGTSHRPRWIASRHDTPGDPGSHHRPKHNAIDPAHRSPILTPTGWTDMHESSTLNNCDGGTTSLITHTPSSQQTHPHALPALPVPLSQPSPSPQPQPQANTDPTPSKDTTQPRDQSSSSPRHPPSS